MKFIKQNILTILLLILLINSIFMLKDLQRKYDDLSSRLLMLQSSINGLPSQVNSKQQSSLTAKPAKDVMSPLELAEYLNIPMDEVYNLVSKDNTMPYVQINGEYRFNKAAIDKWMDGRKNIETR